MPIAYAPGQFVMSPEYFAAQQQTSDEVVATAAQRNEQDEPSPRQQCLTEYYGDSYARAWDISPLSIPSIFTDAGTEYLEDKLSQQANRNLYGNFEQYEAGKRQVRTLAQFRKFNAVMAVAGAGALGYIAGANINCTLLRSD